MDYDHARELLLAQRAELERSLGNTEHFASQARRIDQEPGDTADAAQPLVALDIDAAIMASLRDRLDAIDRALKRLDAGTYGRSIRSGRPIPDERLEADPAAELTIEEARQAG